jgi:hypothetical protein
MLDETLTIQFASWEKGSDSLGPSLMIRSLPPFVKNCTLVDPYGSVHLANNAAHLAVAAL